MQLSSACVSNWSGNISSARKSMFLQLLILSLKSGGRRKMHFLTPVFELSSPLFAGLSFHHASLAVSSGSSHSFLYVFVAQFYLFRDLALKRLLTLLLPKNNSPAWLPFPHQYLSPSKLECLRAKYRSQVTLMHDKLQKLNELVPKQAIKISEPNHSHSHNFIPILAFEEDQKMEGKGRCGGI